MVCALRYSDKYPFRMRSETPDIAIELSLQPWRAFRPDGVIFFSDILTPLPALGIEFDMVKGKGPVIGDPVRSMERVKALKPMEDPSRSLPFIQTILSSLRKELDGSEATLLGFVGTPWTLAAYSMEGKADKDCKETKVGPWRAGAGGGGSRQGVGAGTGADATVQPRIATRARAGQGRKGQGTTDKMATGVRERLGSARASTRGIDGCCCACIGITLWSCCLPTLAENHVQQPRAAARVPGPLDRGYHRVRRLPDRERRPGEQQNDSCWQSWQGCSLMSWEHRLHSSCA